MRAGLTMWAIAGAISLLSAAASAGPKEDLLAADKAFSELSVAKGSNAAFVFYLAEDGRLFGIGGEPPIYGKAAATKRYAERDRGDPAANVLSWSPEHADLSEDGTAGWTDGAWTFVGVPDAKGERATASGHYLTVWKKNTHGQWKVAADMGTKDSVSPSAP
jgi:ketosteroid isomerase-like protein